MAFQKSFEHESGATFPSSYWRVADVSINKAANTGAVIFHGFASQSAADSGKPPVATRDYQITGSEFATALASLINGQVNPLALAYQIALSKKDHTMTIRKRKAGGAMCRSFTMRKMYRSNA